MEALFKISQKYTFKEYKKFAKAVLKWNRIILGAFLWFAFLSGILLIGFNGVSSQACFLVLFPVIYVILRKLSIKRYYNSNKILKDMVAQNQGYIISKEICSEELVEFLKELKAWLVWRPLSKGRGPPKVARGFIRRHK